MFPHLAGDTANGERVAFHLERRGDHGWAGRLLESIGKNTEAARAFERAGFAIPSARLHEAAGDVVGASKVLEAQVRREPGNGALLVALGSEGVGQQVWKGYLDELSPALLSPILAAPGTDGKTVHVWERTVHAQLRQAAKEMTAAGAKLVQSDLDQFPPGAPGNACTVCMYWWANGITVDLPPLS